MPDRLSGTNPALIELDKRLRAATSGVATYVSLLDMLCTSGGCEVAARGNEPDQLLFFDEDHLSVLGSHRVVSSLPPLIAASAEGASDSPNTPESPAQPRAWAFPPEVASPKSHAAPH
jgi:hypothetical protein